MISTVVREHHWNPETINGLYLDDADHFGIEFWYYDTKSMIENFTKDKEK